MRFRLIFFLLLVFALCGCSVKPPAALPIHLTATAAAAGRAIPVIYDDDGSPDGTAALLYLLSHAGVSIQAVNISYGEAYPDVYIQYIARVLDDFGITGMAYGAGQSAPLAGDNAFPESLRQGANDFWGLPLPNPEKTFPVQPAAELIVSAIHQSSQPVTILVSGPGTNLAQAFRLDPSIQQNIAAVVIMGGAVSVPGNLQDFLPEEGNTAAEWNIYADPQAAKEIFESSVQVILVPLDATNLVTVGKENTRQWRKGSPVARFAGDIYNMLLESWGVRQAPVWDLMTAAILANPSLCKFEALHLEVIVEEGSSQGQTALIPDASPNIQVCLEPDVERIRQEIDAVFSSGWLPPGTTGELSR